MKPRHDRSALKVVKYTPPVKPRVSIHGRCSRTQANEWHKAKPKTLTELAIEGKLSVTQFLNAFRRGMINIRNMSSALANPTPEFSRFVARFNDYASQNNVSLA